MIQPIKPDAYITVGITDKKVVSVEWEDVVDRHGKDAKKIVVKSLVEASKFIQKKPLPIKTERKGRG